MQQPTRDLERNLLLSGLPDRDSRHLLARCEQVDLVLADVLYEPGEPIRRVFFPTSSFISLLTPARGHDRLEIGLVGNEGMLGTSLLLDVRSAPVLAVVQGAGSAWQIDAEPFRRELRQSASLRRRLDQYLYVVMCQLAQTATCTRFHVLESRLARWLLMTGDRSHSSKFHVTHELIAGMLGVRRAGVTQAAHSLQERQFIRYSRGNITIRDRDGLAGAACPCYSVDQATYANVLS